MLDEIGITINYINWLSVLPLQPGEPVVDLENNFALGFGRQVLWDDVLCFWGKRISLQIEQNSPPTRKRDKNWSLGKIQVHFLTFLPTIFSPKYKNVSFKSNIFLYQVFVSINRHGQWSVRDVKCFALVGFKGHKVSGTPLLTLDDKCDVAGLTCRVGYGQGLSLRAARSARKIYHLETDVLQNV